MRPEVRKDFRFYVSLLLGFIMLVIGCICPPLGIISNSVLLAGGMILCITAGCIGIDLSEIIHQFTILKMSRCLSPDEQEKLMEKIEKDLKEGE